MTLVPFSPRICLTASIRLICLVSLPSTLMILSPALRPALKAGVSSMGETTVRIPSLTVISIPIPENLPEVSTCSSLNSSGVKKEEWGSREETIPLMAP